MVQVRGDIFVLGGVESVEEGSTWRSGMSTTGVF